MTIPIWDWQFLIVTAVAIGALLVLGRQFLPTRTTRTGTGDQPSPLAKPGCAHCASNAETTPAMPSRTVMTQVVSLRDLRDTARQIKH